MATTNMTPAQNKLLAEHEMFMQTYALETALPNGTVVEQEAVEIMGDSSDLYVAYVRNADGSLRFHMAPDYLEDLPARIGSTRELTALCKHVAAVA